MTTIKKTLIGLFIAGLFLSAHASYIEKLPITVTQPDGTEVACFATGDEYYHWVHDDNGYTLLRDPQTGIVVYATLINDELVPTTYRAGSIDPATVGLTPGLNISTEKRRQLREVWAVRANNYSPIPPGRGGWNNGTINNLVIYIRFSDEEEFPPAKAAKYDGFFNRDEEGQSSMYAYYKAISHEQTFIPSTFYPINTDNAITSYQDINPRGYYQPYNATSNPIGYTNDSESMVRGHQAFRRALEFVADEIPEDLNLDFNNDGLIDNICFLVSGSAGAWSSLLWPHRFSLWFADPIFINGVQAWDYNLLIEKHLDGAGVSVLAHEMSHTLGAPDLYRYAYNGTPVGQWDLMSNDQNPPQSMTAYVQMKYSGWVDNIPEITENGTYTLHNVWSETNNAYKIASPNSTKGEFFVIEYRDKNVYWDSSLPGSGLIIYRINPNYDGNADGPPDEIYIYRSGGTTNMANDGNINAAYFSEQSGRTAFNNATNPPCFLSDGKPGGIAILNISASGGETMSFDIDLDMTNTEINAAPDELIFENIPIGTTSDPQNITVIGTDLKYNLTYDKTGDPNNLFTIEETDWNPLTGGTLAIRYTPEAAKINSATITLKTNGATSQTVSLIANGAIPTTINNIETTDGITIYPNPTNGTLLVTRDALLVTRDELQVTSDELRVTNVEIFDVMGRACNVSRVTRNENEIDISFLPSGIYFIRITTENNVITKKIIKK